MKERRRDPRVPLVLEAHLKRDQWQQHLTTDVSRRGVFVVRTGDCPVTQLIKLRVHLPGEETPVIMMAKVSRCVPLTRALEGDRLPGVGLEFFCLTGEALARWDRFIMKARKLHQQHPDADGYALAGLLETGGDPSILADTPAAPADRSSTTNLIFRAHTMERLESFLRYDLPSGQFDIRIPYHLPPRAPVNLRVIHPITREEFSLPGVAFDREEGEGVLVRFDDTAKSLVPLFKSFVRTGEPPENRSGILCTA